MRRLFGFGLIVVTLALCSYVETARADHYSCYGSRYYSSGYYGAPYRSSYRSSRYYPRYNSRLNYGYRYSTPRYGYYGRPQYGGSGLYFNGYGGGIRFGY